MAISDTCVKKSNKVRTERTGGGGGVDIVKATKVMGMRCVHPLEYTCYHRTSNIS